MAWVGVREGLGPGLPQAEPSRVLLQELYMKILHLLQNRLQLLHWREDGHSVGRERRQPGHGALAEGRGVKRQLIPAAAAVGTDGPAGLLQQLQCHELSCHNSTWHWRNHCPSPIRTFFLFSPE